MKTVHLTSNKTPYLGQILTKQNNFKIVFFFRIRCLTITFFKCQGYLAERLRSQCFLERPQITLNATKVWWFSVRRRSPEYPGKNPDGAEMRTNMTPSREHNLLYSARRQKCSLIHKLNFSNETVVLCR